MNVRLPSSTPSAHASLLLDRYLVDDVARLEKRDKDTPSQEEWRRLTHIAPSTAYKLAFHRWKELLPPTGFTEGHPPFVRIAQEGRTTGRFVTDLRAEGVFEANIRLHHTYGVPLVPGAGLKGALRSFVKHSLGQPEAAAFLFGAMGSAGFAKIYDAWWVPVEENGQTPNPLALDVISVHHADYYGGRAAPTDFDQPIPMHHVTAQGKFWFVLEAPNREWAAYLEKILIRALASGGVGAKKTSGYGGFKL
jgi:CRISPR-associated protein Cmr6